MSALPISTVKSASKSLVSPALAINPLAATDLISLSQLSAAEIQRLFATALDLKKRPRAYFHALEGQTIVLLFEKDSLRTLVSFEVGMAKLGGRAVYLDHRTCRIGQREPIRDYARNLERWTDAIVARTYEHSTIEALAANSSAPVINALSNIEHPCQALADYLTLLERFRSLDGLKISYIGDGNNVCHSLMIGAAILGLSMTVITPDGFEPSAQIASQAQAIAKDSGATITTSNNPDDVAGHDAVYTDTWVSMGQEAETAARLKAFEKYQVTNDVMNAAGSEAVFMHCLPAHRGQEVAAEVIDGPRSVVYDQAENRMHAQNALLLHLLVGANATQSKTTNPKPKIRTATSASLR
jgi:ornithine carbamoyltransferase